MAPKKRLLTLEEVAEYLRIDADDVRRLVEREDIYAIEIMPGIIRIQDSDLRTFLRARRSDFVPMLKRSDDGA